MPILMKSQEPLNNQIEGKTINELRGEIIERLVEFLEFCKIQQTGSKFSLMGPAGKFLNLIKTTGEIDWGKIRGYIANVIRNNQNWIAPRALELLEEVCNQLALIKENLISPIQWLNLIDGIDYELFFQLFKTDRTQRDNYIMKSFQEYLEKRFKTIETLDISPDVKYQNFQEIPHPREFPNPTLVEEFWNVYKKEKKK